MKIYKKSILLVVPEFFGYEDRIYRALINEGSYVYKEYGFVANRCIKYSQIFTQTFFCKKRDIYYNRLLSKYKDVDLDFLLVIEGLRITPDFIKEFKKVHPKTVTICYNWDSVRLANYLNICDLFDRNYTFDYKDAEDYGIEFVPTFYCPEFAEIAERQTSMIYDLIFIGSFKANRLDYINRIREKYGKVLNIKVVLYMSPVRYVIEVLKGNKIGIASVVFRPISFDNYLSILSKTAAVLDYTADNQTGLPLRIYETLAAKRKLITNNIEVIKEFGSNKNIVLYNDNLDLKSFIESEKEFVDISYFSLTNFIKRLFK